MKFQPTQIADVILIQPQVFQDPRGFFFEFWHARKFAEHGLDVNFVQDNHSKSARESLRGLHYQLPNAQGKLVRAIQGKVFDVAVDLRQSSETFGRWVGAWLSARNKTMMWIPPGFAHGFYVVTASAEMVYKATDFYSPQDEHVIRWNDPELGIDWPLIKAREPRLSSKDGAGKDFRAAPHFE